MISKAFRELLLKVQTQLKTTETLRVAFDKAREDYDTANRERLDLEKQIQGILEQEFPKKTHIIVNVGEETWMLTNNTNMRFDSLVRSVQVEK